MNIWHDINPERIQHQILLQLLKLAKEARKNMN